MEDYLEAVYILFQKQGDVRCVDVAEYLEVTKPSVSRAVKELTKAKYLRKDSSGILSLTSSGEQVAAAVYGDEDAFLKVQGLAQSASRIELMEFRSQRSTSALEIRENQRRVFCKGREIPLTKTEYEILLYLFQNINQVLTHDQIYEKIWKEPDYGEARKLVSHHVQSIRRKLNLGKDSSIRLRCIRDVGYSLETK